MLKMKGFIFLGLAILFTCVKSDTPANCTFEDILGDWIFTEGKRVSGPTVDCRISPDPVAHTLKVSLHFPNVAVDSFGNKGFWTIVYNQGFEVVVNNRKYFAFSSFQQVTPNVTKSFCDRTLPGWSHDILGNNWACYYGRKAGSPVAPKISVTKEMFFKKPHLLHSEWLVNKIHQVQKSWTAKTYQEIKSMEIQDLIRRAGGKKSRVSSPSSPATVSDHIKKLASQLPVNYDWRNVSGVNYVSPVRNQGNCGSCYAFSSLAMLEARLRIKTNNTVQIQFSPQDVVSCSEYSQGCEGGFPYVIAGKYAQDFGALPEDCFPYEGHDGNCTKKNCKRYYVAQYEYVGGFYGGCNEELMRLDLVQNGPITVAFQVYPDFTAYSSGIYHHTGIGSKFNPFKEVNHGVLITGYGVDDKTGEKFWIVKNSWGTTWGENGFFRIRRGTNECNIESMAVSALPIP